MSENLVREVIKLRLKIRKQKDRKFHPAYADALMWLDQVETCLALAEEMTSEEYQTRFDMAGEGVK